MQSVKRIEILVTCRSLLKFLNLCNRNGVYIRDVKVPNFILYCVFLLPITYELVMTCWYVLETDMEMQRKSNIMCAVVAKLQVILTYISMIKSNQFTMDTIDHMQQIVNARCEKTPESLKIYEEYEENNAKVVKFIWKFGIVFVAMILTIPLLFPLGYALFEYPPPKLWLLPIPSKTPFDRETYFGFIACVFLQSFGSVAWTFAYIAPLILYLGLCSFIVAYSMDFKTIIVRLDDQVTLNRYTDKKKKNRSIDVKLILTEAFQAHLDLFRLLENTRKSVSGYLYFQFLFTLNYIAYVVFGLNGVTKELNFNALTVYYFLFTSISLNFLLCYYADNLTNHACGIGDEIYGSLWYELPLMHQKLLLMPISRAQIIFRLKGLGIFTYSLENFSRILLRSHFTRLIMFQMTGNRSPMMMVVKDITNMNI